MSRLSILMTQHDKINCNIIYLDHNVLVLLLLLLLLPVDKPTFTYRRLDLEQTSGLRWITEPLSADFSPLNILSRKDYFPFAKYHRRSL